MSNKRQKKKDVKRMKRLHEEKKLQPAKRQVELIVSRIIKFTEHRKALLTNLAKEPIDILVPAMRRIISEDQIRPTILGNAFPKTFAQLNREAPTFLADSLSHEINWSTCLFINCSQEINAWLIAKQEFEAHFILGNFVDADECLSKCFATWGWSLWLIEAKIMLFEYWRGTSANKEFLESLNGDSLDNRLILVFASYCSQKVERSVSALNYDRIANSLIESLESQAEDTNATSFKQVLDYLKFAINFFGRRDIEEVSFLYILHEAGEISLIDRYVAYMKALESLATREELKRIPSLLKEAVELAAERLTDSRLKRISMLWGNETSIGMEDNADVMMNCLDAYTTGNYPLAIKLSYEAIKQSPICFEFYEINAKSLINSGRLARQEVLPGLSGIILNNMLEVYLKNEMTFASLNLLRKIAYTIDSSKIGTQLFAFCREHSQPDPKRRNRILANLNTDYPSPRFSLELELLPAKHLLEQLRKRYSDSPTVFLFLEVNKQLRSRTTAGIQLAAPPERLLKYEAFTQEKVSFPQKALESYLKLYDQTKHQPTYQQDAISGLSRCYLATQELDRCADLLIEEYLTREPLVASVPFEDLLTSYRAAGLEKYSADISWSLLFWVHFTKTDFPKDNIILFVLYDSFLASQSLERPSEIRGHINNYRMFEIVKFLQVICVPEIMDSSICFANTQDVEEERIAICELLSEIDGDNRPQYLEEITRLKKAGVIRSAIHEVDNSKVFVDTASIRRTLDKSIRENYDRLQTIASTEPHIRNLIYDFRLDASDFEVLIVDSAFFLKRHIFNEIKNRFTSGNEHGLNSYLSTRIRHGTLSGQVRSGIEKHRLITRKDTTDGVYSVNSYWQDVFHALGESIAEQVDLHLKEFSREVDAMIDEVNNEWIQIRGSLHPLGLFDFDYGLLELNRLFLKLDSDESYESFMDSIFQELRARTEKNLDQVRKAILEEMKRRLIEALSRLETQTTRNHHVARNMAFRNAITQCRTTIQNELSTVASWFMNIDEKAIGDYDLRDLIATSIEVVQRFNPSLNIEPNVQIRDVKLMKGITFMSFFDIFSILLENIARHGGAIIPSVTIKVQSQGEWLSIEVTNVMASHLDIETVRGLVSRLEDRTVHYQIGGATTREGGSGYYKLGKIIRANLSQSKALIKVSIDDASAFRVFISMESVGLYA